MKTDRWETFLFQDFLELIDDVVGPEMRTCERTEHIIVFLPGRAGFRFLLYLARTVLRERLKSKWGKRDAPAALFRFGVRLYKLSHRSFRHHP